MTYIAQYNNKDVAIVELEKWEIGTPIKVVKILDPTFSLSHGKIRLQPLRVHLNLDTLNEYNMGALREITDLEKVKYL